MPCKQREDACELTPVRRATNNRQGEAGACNHKQSVKPHPDITTNARLRACLQSVQTTRLWTASVFSTTSSCVFDVELLVCKRPQADHKSTTSKPQTHHKSTKSKAQATVINRKQAVAQKPPAPNGCTGSEADG